MGIHRGWWGLGVFCFLLLWGCSRKEPAHNVPKTKVRSQSQPVAAAERTKPASLSGVGSLDDAAGRGDEPAPLANDTFGAFQLFSPPKIDVPVIKQSEDRGKDEPVRLIGFVNVDSPQALLAFDGKIRGMEVGETYKDVEVIEIDPPQVTLQRGENRWRTTLFDQPIVNRDYARNMGSRGGPKVTIGQGQERLGSGNWQPGEIGALFPNLASGGAAAPLATGPDAGAPPVPALPTPVNDAGQIPLPPIPQIPGIPGGQ